MSVNLFDVDPEMIRDDYFPSLAPFGLDTQPTETTVERWINQEAATLEGKLRRESITASTITDSDDAAFLWCQKTLSLMVLLRSGWPQAAGISESMRKDWEDELEQRLKDLGEDGVLALGGSLPVPSVSPNGPVTHINTLGLDIGDTSLASDVAPVLRRSDEL